MLAASPSQGPQAGGVGRPAQGPLRSQRTGGLPAKSQPATRRILAFSPGDSSSSGRRQTHGHMDAEMQTYTPRYPDIHTCAHTDACATHMLGKKASRLLPAPKDILTPLRTQTDVANPLSRLGGERRALLSGVLQGGPTQGGPADFRLPPVPLRGPALWSLDCTRLLRLCP